MLKLKIFIKYAFERIKMDSYYYEEIAVSNILVESMDFLVA